MSTTPTTINITTQKVNVGAEYQALITGIDTLLTGVDPFVLGNTTISRADLLAKLQSRLDAFNATKAAKMAFHTAVQSESDLDAAVQPLRALLKAYLQARYGKTSSQLQQFGFTPNRVPSKSVQAKATGVAKSQATRAARHTMGKQQKSAIHGTVAEAAASPPQPDAPAPGTAPAAAPAGSTASTPATAAPAKAPAATAPANGGG